MSELNRPKTSSVARAALAAALVLVSCVDLHVEEPGAVIEVRVKPDTVSLRVGDTLRVKAAPLDATNSLLGQKVATWSSAAPGVAAVNASGLVQAVGPGSTIVTATADGIQGHAVVLVSGPPATIAVLAGNGQSAAVNADVAVAPAVAVTDAGGFPVKGATVTFAITAGGGVASPGAVVTDVAGVAALTSWTMGPSAGANTMTATATGTGITGNPVTFTATGTVGPPNAAQSTVTASPATIVPSNGQSFSTITVTVKDVAGSTITGASVVLAATGTGNILTQPTAVTDNQGRATGAISSSVAETKVISATVNGSLAITQTASVSVSIGAPAGLGVSTQPAGATSNALFATQPVVDIRDGFGNRVMTATDPVTVTLVAGNGTLIAAGATTVNAVNGRATFSGLRIRGPRASGDTLGTGPHALQFSAPGYAAVRSDTFQVAVSFAYNVLDVYTRNGCIGCHGFTYANTVNQNTTLGPCTPRTRIVAADTVNSAIYEKIRTATPACGGFMPPAGLMSSLQVHLVRDWILQGAPNN